MLSRLLALLPEDHASRWIPGMRFAAFPDRAVGSGEIAGELAEWPFDLVVHGMERRRRLYVRTPTPVRPAVVSPEVLAGRTNDGGEVVLVAYDRHTLVGLLEEGGAVHLCDEDGAPSPRRGRLSVSQRPGDVVVLALCGLQFALAAAPDIEQARGRALAGLSTQPWEEAGNRLEQGVDVQGR